VAWITADGTARTGGVLSAIGKRMVKMVPLPVSVSKLSEPPCFSITTEREMARPCPVPRPTSLVVKKGRKTLSRAASGMPVPSSEMET